MTLCLSFAEECDVYRIAEVHLASFGSNMMLQAQFPTAAIREGLRTSLIEKATEEIRYPQWAILVVRDQNEIISFAKWKRPVFDTDAYLEAPWRWPEGTKMEVLDTWTSKVDDVSRRVFGSTPCYCLSYIGTDPKHQRRGAATMLIRWGMERSMSENVPIQLESTMIAWPLYEKLGFQAKANICMQLEGIGNDGEAVDYEEMSLVFQPPTSPAIVTKPLETPPKN
ncbi:hypothetical protein AJ79_07902 [Helicocarpus griseus UAMH5409]|uniref:N-acetyltransferase domain-containing protein n=1 Tax=Helicocarpus griseus UAMH5409 TaxID=1447875 RepID=A0A2B7WQ18_9EURO|nr:hypothetical protein AJ79_07902 [Helicocarpus griseus UAMH5409]